MVVAHFLGCSEADRSHFMEDVLVVVEDARTPTEHCQGTHDEGTIPTNAQIWLCDELATYPGGEPFLHPYVHPPSDPSRHKVVKKMRRTF